MSQASPMWPVTRIAPPLFALAIFTSAALVFTVEPMIAKLILPKLGGSPAVWNTSMVFFQAALLVGYGYAHLMQRIHSLHVQLGVHLVALVLAALTLPLHVSGVLGDPDTTRPIPWLLGVLALSVGAPFAVLSATAPLLQAWYARVRAGEDDAANPYVLYAASNLGSFVALLAYPTLVEPLLRLSSQREVWSLGYGVFIAVVVVLGAVSWRTRAGAPVASLVTSPPTPWREKLVWVLLAAGPSSLMLGVTMHLTMDVASAPFLWVIPLAIYLLTFVLAFQSRPLVPVPATLLLQAVLAPICISFLPFNTGSWALQFALNIAAFFVTALMCHQLLSARRPPPDRLTEFYLLLSLGGVIGGVFNALIAPVIFHTVWEYPLVLVLVGLARPWGGGRFSIAERVWLITSLVMAALSYAMVTAMHLSPGFLDVMAHLPFSNNAWDNEALITHVLLGAAAIGAFMIRGRALAFTLVLAAIAVAAEGAGGRSDLIHSERSFFGVLRVATGNDAAYEGAYHELLNGTTLHGAQIVSPRFRCHPMTYYAPATPIGQAATLIEKRGKSADLGVVGLGSGAMAAYDRRKDSLTYFEIDPQVVRLARTESLFTYIGKCAQGPVKMVLGDARLSLAHQPSNSFDLLVVDAFSSDSVPTHLLTTQALREYLRVIKPNGVVLLHLSNRNLEITSSSIATAKAVGASVLGQLYVEPDRHWYLWAVSTEAIVLARSPAALADFAADRRWKPAPAVKTAPWTDDYTNLIGALWRNLHDDIPVFAPSYGAPQVPSSSAIKPAAAR